MKTPPSGLGMWIAFGKMFKGGIDEIVSKSVDLNMKWLAPRLSDGGNVDAFWNKSTSKDYIERCHNAGIKVYGWIYNRPSTLAQELDIMDFQIQCGIDGFIHDPEVPYINQFAAADTFMNAQNKRFPDVFFGYAPFSYIGLHGDYPYKQFNAGCDAIFDQLYIHEFNNNGAVKNITSVDSQWDKWNAQNPSLVKPRYPIYTTYGAELAQKWGMKKGPPGTYTEDDLTYYLNHYSVDESTPLSFYTLEAANNIFINHMKSLVPQKLDTSTNTSFGSETRQEWDGDEDHRDEVMQFYSQNKA